MAGIGFELKRLFSKRGILSTMRAYGYAGIVCTGPMLLGVVLQLASSCFVGPGAFPEARKTFSCAW